MTRERADKVLVARGLFDSRAKAQAAIEAGLVSADGVQVKEASSPIAPDAKIDASAPHPWVSRGGVKLAFALDQFGVSPEGRACLDLGASTGGFCDVLLSRGAARIYAVDVGHGQLHPKIVADPRVTNLEGTDSRALSAALIAEPPSLITADLSFIGLAKALGPALALVAPGADLVTLIKPQFELGPKRLGKGGVVKDNNAVAEATQNVAAWLQSHGWQLIATAESPILGGDGNREGLLHARKTG